MRSIAALALTALTTPQLALAVCHTVCREPDYGQCQAHWKAIVEHAKYTTLREIDLREQELPALIGRCELERSALDGEHRRVELDLAEVRGGIGENERTVADGRPLWAGMEEQQATLARLRPIVESAVPVLVLELRGYLTAQETAVDLRIADVLDAAARETDPRLRRALEFEAQALGDLKALKEQVGDATRVDELLRASFSEADGIRALELLTPLTRSLVEASREALSAWKDGALAYNDLVASFTDTRARLDAFLQGVESRLELGRRQRDALEASLSESTRLMGGKGAECAGLQAERDSGIAERRARAYGEIDAGNREFGQCGARHCRTECADHGGGHGDW